MNTRLWIELRNLHPALRLVFDELVELWVPDDLRISSIYRTPTEDAKLKASGIHVSRPHRAMDIDVFDWGQAQKYADEINLRWVYDPTRPAFKVALGRPHGTGPHLHLQVHDRTHRALTSPVEVIH